MIVLVCIAVMAACASFTFTLVRRDQARERELVRERRIWEKERRDLIDRLMYANGQMWTPPPPSIPDEEDGPLAEVVLWPDMEPID